MFFTGACRVVAILIVFGSVVAFANNYFLMSNIDGELAQNEFLRRALSKNGLTFIIGVVIGTLADIGRSVQSKPV
jgi:Mn2+/Fe2+ NRAMP family transporter